MYYFYFKLKKREKKKKESLLTGSPGFPFSPAGPGPPGNPYWKETYYHPSYIDKSLIFLSSRLFFDRKMCAQLIIICYKGGGADLIAGSSM